MSGPEEIPYGTLGAYANAISAQHNLSQWQTLQFVIDKIPAKALSRVSQETYAQTAALSDKPESPDYFGALESIAWADKIEDKYRAYVAVTGLGGALLGGTVGVAAHSAYIYNSYPDTYTEQPVLQEDDSFLDAAATAGLVVAPILAAGIVGAYVAKRYAPKMMKLVARETVKYVKASETDSVVDAPDAEMSLVPEDVASSDAQSHTPSGSYLESVEERLPYRIAKKWANFRGCDDEQKYADFLMAEMPTAEISELISQTKARYAAVLTDRDAYSLQDPKYTHLLHDMHMVRAIANRRLEAQKTLEKAYRGVGYLGALSILGFQVSSVAEAGVNLFTAPIPYSTVLFLCTQLAATTASMGQLLSVGFAKKTSFLTRQRSKQVADDASR